MIFVIRSHLIPFVVVVVVITSTAWTLGFFFISPSLRRMFVMCVVATIMKFKLLITVSLRLTRLSSCWCWFSGRRTIFNLISTYIYMRMLYTHTTHSHILTCTCTHTHPHTKKASPIFMIRISFRFKFCNLRFHGMVLKHRYTIFIAIRIHFSSFNFCI